MSYTTADGYTFDSALEAARHFVMRTGHEVTQFQKNSHDDVCIEVDGVEKIIFRKISNQIEIERSEAA